MAQYRVTIKKTTEATVVIEADSAAEARTLANAEPADLFAISESLDRDLFTVVKVTKASS